MIIKYIIGIVLGLIISSGLSILITIIRYSIPMCNTILKETTKEYEILALKELKKRYIISIVVWLSLISLNYKNIWIY